MSSTGSSSELKPTLGLIGVTINAMALIAPGAFLWTTFQLQAPKTSATNMWASVALATIIALLTASCYATLSKAYPEAGAGSSYYYAEAAILAQEEHKHFRFARLAKFVTGWTGGIIGVLIGLGLTSTQVTMYAQRVSLGQFLLILEGTKEEIFRAQQLLNHQKISKLN